MLEHISRRIHGRHPAIRRCGITAVKKELAAIARRVPAAERIALLHRVDRIHAAWCACTDWLKENGQYAKGLENWLAPTKERWNEAPPSAITSRLIPEPPKLMM